MLHNSVSLFWNELHLFSFAMAEQNDSIYDHKSWKWKYLVISHSRNAFTRLRAPSALLERKRRLSPCSPSPPSPRDWCISILKFNLIRTKPDRTTARTSIQDSTVLCDFFERSSTFLFSSVYILAFLLHVIRMLQMLLISFDY